MTSFPRRKTNWKLRTYPRNRFIRRGAKQISHQIQLLDHIFTRKQGLSSKHFRKYTSYAPNINSRGVLQKMKSFRNCTISEGLWCMISSIEINNTDISIKLLAFTKYFLMLGDLDKQKQQIHYYRWSIRPVKNKIQNR